MLAGIYAVGQQELAAWQQCQALSWVLTGISMLLSARSNSVATEAVVQVMKSVFNQSCNILCLYSFLFEMAAV